MLAEVFEAVAPHLLEAFGAIVTLAVGWLSVTLKRKLGLDIEAQHRAALHSAMMTGAQMAMDGKLSGDAAKRLIVDYVRSSVPDAIRALSAPDGVLMRMAEAKLSLVLK